MGSRCSLSVCVCVRVGSIGHAFPPTQRMLLQAARSGYESSMAANFVWIYHPRRGRQKRCPMLATSVRLLCCINIARACLLLGFALVTQGGKVCSSCALRHACSPSSLCPPVVFRACALERWRFKEHRRASSTRAYRRSEARPTIEGIQGGLGIGRYTKWSQVRRKGRRGFTCGRCHSLPRVAAAANFSCLMC